MKLDLGCGKYPQDGYEGVDWAIDVESTWFGDLFHYPWKLVRCPSEPTFGDTVDHLLPLFPETVEALYSSHLVEHCPDLIGFMNEAHRVLMPGGEFVIRHPYQFSVRAWQDPTHVRALNEMSWFYYSAQWREVNGLEHMGITADFQVVKREVMFSPYLLGTVVPHQWRSCWVDVDSIKSASIIRAMTHDVNVIDDLQVTLVKR